MEGQLTTPSVVAYDEDGTPYVGTAAKANMANDPERTVSFIKREMSNDDYRRRIGNININRFRRDSQEAGRRCQPKTTGRRGQRSYQQSGHHGAGLFWQCGTHPYDGSRETRWT